MAIPIFVAGRAVGEEVSGERAGFKALKVK
jgi:hypothetical protein